MLALGAPAGAHVELRKPYPRDIPLKDGPCGAVGSTRGATACQYRPGATIRIQFEETVEHPGHYRVSFDDDGQDFLVPTGPNDTATGPGVTIINNNITDRDVELDGVPLYYQDITLPDVECDNCTLQLIQVMSTAASYTESNMYYQCNDVVLSNDAPEVPTGDCAVVQGGGEMPDAGDGGGGGGGGGADGDAGIVQGETVTSGAVGGCAAGGGAQGAGVLLAGLAALIAFARRRRA